MQNEDFLLKKLHGREANSSLRTLDKQQKGIDFYSNDYLGLAGNKDFQGKLSSRIRETNLSHGSTGSRLISGNHPLFEEAEKLIADFHEAEAALIFNSGYDANTGLLSSIPGREDVILYDSLVHASVRDGIRLSLAVAFSFAHNDPKQLEEKLQRIKKRVFVVVESVYSMDGDKAALEAIVFLCKKYRAYLIVDEAHATGVVGQRGEGLVQHLGLQDQCFARIPTFGKALGVHGAAIVGSNILKQFLLNYARSFIYTTALPPAPVAAIVETYRRFPLMKTERDHLKGLITLFQKADIPFKKKVSETPIQIVLTPGNEQAKKLEKQLQKQGFMIRAILSPTVPKGSERLRIILHSFNTREEVEELVKTFERLKSLNV